MKTKYFLILLLPLFTSACKPPVHVMKGKFYEGLTLVGERHFSHSIKGSASALDKITDEIDGISGYGYYTWKTIRTNVLLNNQAQIPAHNTIPLDSTRVSIYRTLYNSEIMDMKDAELSYIKGEGNVLMNNLYFIDNYRCIYISFDDARGGMEVDQIIPLYFDNTSYVIPKKKKKRFEQYLRGYYSVSGTEIFIHFENPFSMVSNFVKGKIKNNTITFQSMTVPNSPNQDYEAGYNANMIDFKVVFNANSMPVFEPVYPVRDIIYPAQTTLSMGFEWYENKTLKNEIHQSILLQNPSINRQDTLAIRNIIYERGSDSILYRKYIFEKFGFPGSQYEVLEGVELSPLGDACLIKTW